MKTAPEVDFYGGSAPWPTAELVHSERLVERSALHDWTIRPHRHNQLVQLFLILEGHGRARFDSTWHAVRTPSLLVVPERVVHEFVWDSESDGFVLSIRTNLLASLAQRAQPLGNAFASPAVIDVTASRPFYESLFTEIDAEANSQRTHKELAMDSLLRVLGTRLARYAEAAANATPPASRAAQHFARFRRSVNLHHKSHWSVAEHASAVGLTPSHLNAVCRDVAGKSALDVIHERLTLAARRQLVYTERNIAGIAHYLGFADPSYFTRFFKRETGMTPRQYRRRSGTFDGEAVAE